MNIIGQKKLLSEINHLLDSGTFPRYSILQGPFGSGKKMIASYIAKKLDATFVPCELSVDSVREVIDLSYTMMSPTLYMWADAHKMSMAAKNAILKITEEPPQNAYFVMTTDNIKGLLGTLLSRGTLLNINPYNVQELTEFAKLKLDNAADSDIRTIVGISTTPQDILELSKIDIKQMNKVVGVLCDNIGSANLANSLKVSTFLRYKEEETEKYDPTLFLRACMVRYSRLLQETMNPVYAKLVGLTSTYLADLSSKSLSKVATVDNWIIDTHTTMVSEGSL